MLLIRAEALARQNDLVGAVDTYNLIRERAGLPPHTLGNEVTTQEDVLAAIDLERQLELAFEGDRWPDLVRTGRAVEVMRWPSTRPSIRSPRRRSTWRRGSPRIRGTDRVGSPRQEAR